MNLFSLISNYEYTRTVQYRYRYSTGTGTGTGICTGTGTGTGPGTVTGIPKFPIPHASPKNYCTRTGTVQVQSQVTLQALQDLLKCGSTVRFQ
jgi:hypothetical protein